MKLTFKNNLGENFIDRFSDIELEILHMYYQKLIKSTEFKFLKQLFQSLPKHCRTKLKQQFKKYSEKKTSLISYSSIKSINIQQLDEDYIISAKTSIYHKSRFHWTILTTLLLVALITLYLIARKVPDPMKMSK